MAPFRILSMDGGGSWALIQVKALIALFGNQATGHDVLSQFDLAAANSGGSIVLGCLIENFTLQQILDFFHDETQRKAVFSKTEWEDRLLYDILRIGPRYSADVKLPALRKVLAKCGGLLLPDAVTGIRGSNSEDSIHVLMVGFDYDRNRAAFFRSRKIEGPSWGCGEQANVTLAEAIHASTNAPVNYFDGPAKFDDRPGRYWDGALGGWNNPVLAAVIEAIGLKQDSHNIVALSLGTGNTALPSPQPGDPPSLYTQPPSELGLRSDIKKLATSILDDPPDAATFLAHVITGCGAGMDPSVSRSRIIRMNPLVSPRRAPAGASDRWKPPEAMTHDQFMFILNLDMDAVEQEQVDAITQYADLWMNDQALNQPIRMDSQLNCELGQDKFSAAREAWLRISSGNTGMP